MKSLSIAALRLYRRCLSRRLARTCLFEVSCSEFALAQLSTAQPRAHRRVISRLAMCRPGYVVVRSATGEWGIRCRNGNFVSEEETSRAICAEIGLVRSVVDQRNLEPFHVESIAS